MWSHLTHMHYHCISNELPGASGSSHSSENSVVKCDIDKQTTTLPQMFSKQSMRSYDRNSQKCNDIDRSLARFVMDDIRPISIVEGHGFKNFVNALDPRYTIPSRRYLLDNKIVPLYHTTKDLVKNKIRNCTRLALTTDAWSSLAQDSYNSLTCHLINKESFEIESYLLQTKHMTKSHTAETLYLS